MCVCVCVCVQEHMGGVMLWYMHSHMNIVTSCLCVMSVNRLLCLYVCELLQQSRNFTASCAIYRWRLVFIKPCSNWSIQSWFMSLNSLCVHFSLLK